LSFITQAGLWFAIGVVDIEIAAESGGIAAGVAGLTVFIQRAADMAKLMRHNLIHIVDAPTVVVVGHLDAGSIEVGPTEVTIGKVPNATPAELTR